MIGKLESGITLTVEVPQSYAANMQAGAIDRAGSSAVCHKMTLDCVEKPICVDLDGTLIKTDLLLESALSLFRRKPYLMCLMPGWLLRGRAYLKRELAKRVFLDIKTLPYNVEFLNCLRSEHEKGRKIVLTTAADGLIAAEVAEHCGVFAEVIASDGRRNVSGKVKRDELVQRFGEKGFVYAGNASVDLPIWEQAAGGIVVNGTTRLAAMAGKRTHLLQVFSSPGGRLRAMAKALRLHQWVKNLLVFIPLVAAHRLSDGARAMDAILAFCSFCCGASGMYVLNDLLDLGADRVHPVKRFRPFASGDLSLSAGLMLVPILLAGSLAFAWFLNGKFLSILGLYLALTVLYSMALKRIVLVDVLCLAGLYTIRVFAGGLATGTPVSNWLLAFSGFFFLSLALAKRASEVVDLKLASRGDPEGRSYLLSDLEQISSMGAGSGYISVLVLVLYINSPEVSAFYLHPERLWFVCPLIFYWISRIWLLTHRGLVHEDPVVFALKDKASYAVGLVVCLIVLWATGMR